MSGTGFIKVAELKDVPQGATYEANYNGEAIILANVDGQIYAYTWQCPHGQMLLNGALIEGAILTCPWHGSQYDLRTGEVVRGPSTEALPTFKVRVQSDDIMVSA